MTVTSIGRHFVDNEIQRCKGGPNTMRLLVNEIYVDGVKRICILNTPFEEVGYYE